MFGKRCTIHTTPSSIFLKSIQATTCNLHVGEHRHRWTCCLEGETALVAPGCCQRSCTSRSTLPMRWRKFSCYNLMRHCEPDGSR